MTMDRNKAATLLLAACAAAGLYLCYLLFRPYTTPILFASVTAIVFYPLHRYTRKIVHSAGLSALISTLVTVLLTVVPLTFLLLAISDELTEMYRSMATRNTASGGMAGYFLLGMEKLTAWAGRYFPVPTVDLHAILLGRLESAGTSLFRFGASLVSNVFSFVTSSVIALVVLFFLFRDGESAVAKLMEALPLDEDRMSHLRSRVTSGVIANFYGSIVIGALQGTLTGLTFRGLGIDSPVLWGFVTGVLSLVPIFGSAMVWVPASLVLLLTGHYVKAMILLGLGTALIGTVDNIVRPLIMQQSTRLHSMLVFFALLGGVQWLGVPGLFVGPIILSVTAALIGMLREDLHRAGKTEAGESPPPSMSAGDVRHP